MELFETLHLAKKLQLLMTRRGHTQASLGEVLGVSHRAVGKWLADDSRPGAAVALDLARHFDLPVGVLLNDDADLPPDETEQRYAEAKAVAEHYPADNQKARQLAFEKQLERSAYAKTLRDTATRLRDEAEILERIADELQIQATRSGASSAVAEKVAEAARLRIEAAERRQGKTSSGPAQSARPTGT